MTIDVLRSATPKTLCEWGRAEARVMEDIFLSRFEFSKEPVFHGRLSKEAAPRVTHTREG
jgi:hypothetical protein